MRMRWILALAFTVLLVTLVRRFSPSAGSWVWPQNMGLRVVVLAVVCLGTFFALGRLHTFRDLEAEAHRAEVRALMQAWSRAWIGQEFLYVEPCFIAPIRIEDVHVRRNSLSIAFTVLPERGYVHPRNIESARVSVHFDGMAITRTSITALNIPWSIYIDPALVAPINTLAAEQGDSLTTGDRGALERFGILARALADRIADENAKGAAKWYRAVEGLPPRGPGAA